jgi:hypothetical protein
MARATIIVEKWSPVLGWQYDGGYPSSDEDLALLQARVLEARGTPVRIYRRTPDGPQVIYESPKS